MKRYSLILGALLTLPWALAPAATAAEQMVLSIGAVQGSPGQEVDVPINIKGAHNVGALQLRLTYDPAVLDAKKVERGEGAAKVNLEPAMKDGQIFVVIYTAQDPISHDGVVFHVLAQVRGTVGQKTPLKLLEARGWDLTDSAPLLLTSQDGDFTVVASPWPGLSAMWWGVTAGTGVLFLLLVGFASRGSRRPKPAAIAADIPTYGTALTFKHHCNSCQQVIDLPQSALGRQFKCAGCGAVQVGGQ